MKLAFFPTHWPVGPVDFKNSPAIVNILPATLPFTTCCCRVTWQCGR
uniref:Uncharacterized protein n=1 Tax=Anguilla anguilla TaxID=7936 RepID=A0A0E9UNM0_ANGAN